MKADLHVHTSISDGSFNVEDTIRIAKANGVTHLGITNHDTIEGLREAMEEGAQEGIRVIPGIEISAWDSASGKKVHILGYCFNLQGESIRRLCGTILERRQENSIRQIQLLLENNYYISYKNISRRARNSRVIYKQHIMAELMEKGYTDCIYSDLYRKLFKSGGICAGDIEYVDAVDAVKAVKADNGIAVLAHPGQLDSYSLIDMLVKAGLDGIELNHEDHKAEDLRKIEEYRNKYNLLLTGGSDFHGEYGTAVTIGDFTTPEEYVHIFEEHLPEAETPVEELSLFARKLVKAAGRHLKEAIRDNLRLCFKNNDCSDIVTSYDVEIESFLIKNISERYPHHTFITEEKSCTDQGFSEYTWIIDPIDGTTNFVSIGKEFSISVALYHNMTPLMGIVYDVQKDRLYSAAVGRGAFVNGIPLNKISKNHALKDSLIDMSLKTITALYEADDAKMLKIIKAIRGHRAFGSAALSICKIAIGELQGYVSANLNLWDYAAAIVILMEAGGCYTHAGIENAAFPMEQLTFIAAENMGIIDGLREYVEL
ncbi:MAG: inositol monophosphatase family protein [Bacillota bacterium]|nr:inositol monophosphatase family protein [Bacillota bacterium]